MVCPSCQLAGRVLRDQPERADVIARFHLGCPGGTWCDCQHVTASMTARFS